MGAYLEQLVSENLHECFHEDKVLQNLKYDGSTERDAAVILDDAFMAIACKTKALRADTRAGFGVSDQIENFVKSGVEEGIEQATSLIDYVKANGTSTLTTESKKVEELEIDSWIPIVVMGDHYGNLTTMDFNQYIQPYDIQPYVIDYYDFDIILKRLEPDKVIEFIIRRRQLYNSDIEIKSQDELDYLWAFERGLLNTSIWGFLESLKFNGANKHTIMNLNELKRRYSIAGIFNSIPYSGLLAEWSVLLDEDGKIKEIQLPIHGGEIRHEVYGKEGELPPVD